MGQNRSVMRPAARSPRSRFVRRVVRVVVGVTIATVGLTVPATRPAAAQSTPDSASVTTTLTPTTVALPTPVEYATKAFDFIERYALRRNAVDWPTIRQRAEERVRPARSIPDTYAIISDTLKALGDRHSSFQKPPDAVLLTSGRYSGYGFTAVWPQRTVVTLTTGSPAAQAGLKLGDRIDLVDGKIPRNSNGVLIIPKGKDGDFPLSITLTLTRKGEKKSRRIVIKRGEPTLISVPKAEVSQSQQLPGRIGYVELPGLVGTRADQDAYAAGAQSAIRQIDAVPRCGWVVDLRKNRGGYIYPMLAGAGPLLGEGTVGGKLDAGGVMENWIYEGGSIRLRRPGAPGTTETTIASAADVVSSVPGHYVLARPEVPVAVLTSNLTASAGEATAIAFRSRPNTRSFGEATIGLTTFNVMTALPDGATIIVTNAVDADRSGQTYDGPVPPDEQVTIDWNHFSDAQDPVLNAAVRWLATQGSCAPAA